MDVGYVGYGWEMRGVASTSFSHSLLPLLPAPSFGVIYIHLLSCWKQDRHGDKPSNAFLTLTLW